MPPNSENEQTDFHPPRSESAGEGREGPPLPRSLPAPGAVRDYFLFEWNVAAPSQPMEIFSFLDMRPQTVPQETV